MHSEDRAWPWWLLGYAVGGLLSTILVLPLVYAHTGSRLMAGFACVLCSGVVPAWQFLLEVKDGTADFRVWQLILHLGMGGIAGIFAGTALQWFFSIIGIHSILGFPIDGWFWSVPETWRAY